MEIEYTPSFIRQYKKLPHELQREVKEKIAAFTDPVNHASLRVHHLHGELSSCLSFSVNYRYRIVFSWKKKQHCAVLLGVGDHSVYS